MFTRLTPILPVRDVREELAFYQGLGFDRHVDPDEPYPTDVFAAVSHGDGILFGMARHDDATAIPPAGLEWQFETDDIESVSRLAAAAGLQIASPVTMQSWGRRAMTVISPSGYAVHVEETSRGRVVKAGRRGSSRVTIKPHALRQEGGPNQALNHSTTAPASHSEVSRS